MLKLLSGLISLQFLISVMTTQKTVKEDDSIYLKFHQSDYDVKFEWSEVVRLTKPEVKHITIMTFKYNRTCPAVNMTWDYSIDVGYELEVVAQLHKFASNEYRLFPIRLQTNLCKSLENNLLGVGQFNTCGNFTGCPLRKGMRRVCNWTPNQCMFPPFIPAGRYRIEFQALFRNKEFWIARVYGEVSRGIGKN